VRKKRVLWVNEASFLSTGYSTYGLEVLKRLHETGKFEICELGCYAPAGDPRGDELPWAFVGNMPRPGDEQGRAHYDQYPTHQFGEWKFEDVCLDFKPDIVCDVRDWWMVEFQERSPFRPYYHWAIMPTVDAAPQDEQWVSTFMSADAVFAYTDWGLTVLREQTYGRMKTKCSAPPGADLKTMNPVPDRRAHRQKMGLDEDCLVVGTVMRNQRRKLYPDLIRDFGVFLREAPSELAKKTFLYMHTSWPDLGWDIPRLVTEAGVGHRCLFTYHCRECGAAFPSFFADARTACRQCGSPSAGMPNSHVGVRRDVLNEVMNLFDVYVQYANSEGFGMPQVEAAACGVPVMAVDYSAMSDVVRKLKGMPIALAGMVREPESHCWRAVPDGEDFVYQLQKFLSKPEPVRRKMGYEARKAVEAHYTYDKTAKVWEEHFDSVDVKEGVWAQPPRLHEPPRQIPQGLSDDEFVRWGIQQVAGRPDLLNSYTALRMSRDLTWEATLPGTGGLYFNEASTLGLHSRLQEFNREVAMRHLLRLGEHKNHWEKRRAELVR
jgi:glycosyltransferase involved in cell wall biosynthesis